MSDISTNCSNFFIIFVEHIYVLNSELYINKCLSLKIVSKIKCKSNTNVMILCFMQKFWSSSKQLKNTSAEINLQL